MIMRNSSVEKELGKLEQLEHRKILQDSKERIAKRKNDERRQFIVGKIFLDAFPEFLNIQPQKSAEENEHEFAPVKEFLLVLAANKELVNCLQAKVAESMNFEKSVYDDSKQILP